MIYQPREEGQGLVEYALILVLVAVVVIVILALLGPAIACQPDWATAIARVNSQFFYHFLMSADPAPPQWVRDNSAVTWLPWGSTDIPKLVIFRVIPTDAPVLEAYYHPQGVFCAEETVKQGVEACFQ